MLSHTGHELWLATIVHFFLRKRGVNSHMFMFVFFLIFHNNAWSEQWTFTFIFHNNA